MVMAIAAGVVLLQPCKPECCHSFWTLLVVQMNIVVICSTEMRSKYLCHLRREHLQQYVRQKTFSG
jgi:hypothetical protein